MAEAQDHLMTEARDHLIDLITTRSHFVFPEVGDDKPYTP